MSTATLAPFDYTSYYNAIKNGDETRKNKNPLEIYEKQVLDYVGAGKDPSGRRLYRDHHHGSNPDPPGLSPVHGGWECAGGTITPRTMTRRYRVEPTQELDQDRLPSDLRLLSPTVTA